VNVDEADVGSLTVGQKASFTVSAYPSRRYPAEVTRVSFGSTKTDNVVTYITWLEVDNSDLSLRPGMTAAATITATERNDVLLVPNTACASPRPGGRRGRACQRQPRHRLAAHARPATQRQPQNGWRRGPGPGRRARCGCCRTVPQPVSVKVGISDGRMTEVSARAWSPAQR
jgi:HlyD family secretion protein